MTQGAKFPALKYGQNNTTATPTTSGPDGLKAHEISEDGVIGFDALYDSAMRCRKGVLWKDSVAAYYHRAVERTDKLSRELCDGTYKPAPPKHFTITSPKRREIASVAFRDRVYQRSLNDNLVYPVMTRSFIYDNWACQTGKGTDPARDRLKEFIRKYYRRCGADGWAAQFDIHGYYPNMRHDVAEANFRKKLPEWGCRRVEKILRDQYDGEIGYNPGSQLIQIAGISLLNDLDHMIKEEMRVKYYIRYMDDLIMIHHDREFLKSCMDRVKAELNALGFEVNEKKTRIYPLREGIMFLGFRFRLTETGKVLMHPDPAKIKTARKKYRRLVAKAKRDECTKESADASWATWINHLSKGNAFKLIQRLNEFYRELWEGKENETEKTGNESSGSGEAGKFGGSSGQECRQY